MTWLLNKSLSSNSDGGTHGHLHVLGQRPQGVSAASNNVLKQRLLNGLQPDPGPTLAPGLQGQCLHAVWWGLYA